MIATPGVLTSVSVGIVGAGEALSVGETHGVGTLTGTTITDTDITHGAGDTAIMILGAGTRTGTIITDTTHTGDIARVGDTIIRTGEAAIVRIGAVQANRR